MATTLETNEYGEQVKVTTNKGSVIRELVRPVEQTSPVKTKNQNDAEALVNKKNWVDADLQAALTLLLQRLILGE